MSGKTHDDVIDSNEAKGRVELEYEDSEKNDDGRGTDACRHEVEQDSDVDACSEKGAFYRTKSGKTYHTSLGCRHLKGREVIATDSIDGLRPCAECVVSDKDDGVFEDAEKVVEKAAGKADEALDGIDGGVAEAVGDR